MKRLLLAALTVLVSTAAQASSQAAYAVCDSFIYSSDKLTCLDIVRGGYFQNSALDTCRTQVYSSDKLSCLRSIKNNSYDNDALSVCNSMIYGSDKTSCMSIIKNRSYNSYELNTCRSMIYTSDKLACLKRIGSYSSYPTYPNEPNYPNYPNYPSYPPVGNGGNDRPPRVESDRCYVRQIGRVVSGDEFFSYVHEKAQKNRTCAVAKIAYVPNSGRIYDRDGSRVAKSRGGLSNNEVDQVLRSYGLYGCERYTCDQF